MIQRIQTVYLVLGAVAMGSLFAFDVLRSGVAAEQVAWFTPVVLGLAAVSGLLALGTVFLYTHRERQRIFILGVQGLTVLLLLALYGGLYLADALYVRTTEGLDAGRLVLLVLPLAAYILFFLARRAVTRDIELIRSMDRLR